jgi:hypothetical protein
MTLRSSILLFAAPLLFGCKSSPAPATTATTPAPTPAAVYPSRPAVAPAPFKLFHHGNSSLTLVVNEKVNDDQLSALVWQLRDAAHTHTFDAIHLPQHQVDADGKTVWFHIYRGTKCAPEKYAPGEPPCGGSYHAAADYTFDTHTTPPWEKGTVLHTADDPHPTQLWDSDAPYTPPTK